MRIRTPSTAAYDVPRAERFAIAPCTLRGGVVDVPMTWEEVERDAAWMEGVLATYGLSRGDVVVLAAGPAELVWAHPVQLAISRLGATFGLAWVTPFDAFRVASLARRLGAAMVIGVDAGSVEAMAALPGGVEAQLGHVPHVLARADAHERLEALGMRPHLFDLLGPAVVLEGAARDGGRVDTGEWALAEQDGELLLTTVGSRGLRLDRAGTGRRGVLLGDGDRPHSDLRIVLEGVTRPAPAG